jgi:hypothetical protein
MVSMDLGGGCHDIFEGILPTFIQISKGQIVAVLN